MSKISNITIRNIKGFGTTDNSFDIEILSGKINILVAPNGFGKSSITAAFDSLKTGKIELEKKNFHKGNEALHSTLSLTEDGVTYIANRTTNTISTRFKIFCIKNLINAKAVGKNMGKFVSTSGHLSIDSVEVVKTIPRKSVIPYSISEIKTGFGTNAKILPNISADIINNKPFLCSLDTLYSDLDKFSAKKRIGLIADVLAHIHSLSGTTENIKNRFDATSLQGLKLDSSYISIIEYINHFFPNLSELDQFLYFYQLQSIYHKYKTVLKDTVKRADYEITRDTFNDNLDILGATWKNIKAVEEKKSLIVNFPRATDISYGQRDVLTLCIMLQCVRARVRHGDNCIILIDEVFDYLDAVNMTATQYYLSETVNDLKRYCNIYPIIMTHLSPEHFRNYVFSPKRMNVQYLKNVRALPNANMRRLLAKRNDDTVKDEIAKHLLHYSAGEINKRAEFIALGLAELWGESLNFLQYIIVETNKYLANNTDFEPYAVCACVRIRIEKLVYDQLVDVSHKQTFLDTHRTILKLSFAETILGELPDAYYMLGIIYNDAEHLKDENSDKPIIYRLNHVIIKDMVGRLFSYDGTPIKIVDIH